MLNDDIMIVCRQCGEEFAFTRAEQEFYKERGFNEPRRCQTCRAVRAQQIAQAQTYQASQPENNGNNGNGHDSPTRQIEPPRVFSCSQCGAEIEKETLVYCPQCVEHIRLDYEHQAAESREAASAAQTSLETIEGREAAMSEAIQQRDQMLAELQEQLEAINEELQKALHFQSAAGPIETALNGIQERLASMEQSQTKIKDRMLQLAEKIHEMQVQYNNTSLLDMFKRSFRGDQQQSAWQK